MRTRTTIILMTVCAICTAAPYWNASADTVALLAKAASSTTDADAKAMNASRQSEPASSGELGDEAPSQALTISGKLVFVPSNRGTPMARVGGASRGVKHPPGIEALVPLEAGLTLNDQPVLYWYVSATADLPMTFKLIDPNMETPLLDLTLKGPFEKGVHSIRLDEHPVHLAKGTVYQWYVAFVPGPEDHSSDSLAGGGIELVDTKVWLQKQLAEATPEQVPTILAAAGIWYDTLTAISERIEAFPDDPRPRAERAALFEQVGIEAMLAAD